MYSGFKHLTPWAAASLTSTLTWPGFNRLKSTNRWEVSLNSEGEGSGNTYTGGERVNTRQSNQRRGKRKSLPVRSRESNEFYGFSVESKEKRRQMTTDLGSPGLQQPSESSLSGLVNIQHHSPAAKRALHVNSIRCCTLYLHAHPSKTYICVPPCLSGLVVFSSIAWLPVPVSSAESWWMAERPG